MKVKFDDGIMRKTASRWIKRKLEKVTEKHSLVSYANNESDGKWLDYFRHNGKLYAIGQFMRTSFPIMDIEDKGIIIGGYDVENWHNPYCLEIDDSGEYVRLWEEV